MTWIIDVGPYLKEYAYRLIETLLPNASFAKNGTNFKMMEL